MSEDRKERSDKYIEKRPLSVKFWEKVEKTESCWIWTGFKLRGGYGKMFVRRKCLTASRLSWELHYGIPPPDDRDVCHTCDNPPCVRPDHLFLGTAKENTQDAMRKGRFNPSQPGIRHGMHKLTENEVLEIRKLHSEGTSKTSLAKKFQVARGNIGWIISRKTWRHL